MIKYWKYILCIVLCIISYGVGYYTKPDKVVTKIQTITVEKIVQHENVDTTQTIIIKPDKTKTIVTHTTSHTDTKTQVDEKQNTEIIQTKSSSAVVSALVGYNFSNLTPVYGASVTKRVLGPINVGGWLLTNGTCGASVGFSF
jgi:hypothetical protein